MFLYTDFDQNLLNERVAQFRDQTQRYLEGKLTEEEYPPYDYKMVYMFNAMLPCYVWQCLMA